MRDLAHAINGPNIVTILNHTNNRAQVADKLALEEWQLGLAQVLLLIRGPEVMNQLTSSASVWCTS